MSEVLLESTSQRRVRWLARIAFGWSALLLLRLIFLQIVSHGDLANQAQVQQTRIIKEAPARGAILDRHEAPLAMSYHTDSVAVDPRRIKNIELAVSIFSEVLGQAPGDLRKLLRENKHRGNLVIQRGVTQAQVQRLSQWQQGAKMDFIQVYSDTVRRYPENTLAAHILGGTDFQQIGYAGLEKTLNDDMQGVEGRKRMRVDAKNQGFDSEEVSVAEAGASVITTIDRVIQFEVERILNEALKNCRSCEHASVVVMNPQNGEIYAYAVGPGFDINKRPENVEEIRRIRRNRSIEEPYEPGSVFKLVAAAAAMDLRKATAETPIACPAKVKVPGRPTPLSNGHGGGVFPLREAIAQSSNTGAYYIAANLLGKENLHRYIRAFGFGSRTGIELPAESAGTVKPLRIWKQPTVAMAAMGYEVSATTIQLAQATSIIANGGRRVKPTLLKQRMLGTRLMNIAAESDPEQVIRPETAIAMRRVLEWVVLSPHGTGRAARLDGWSAAGKTGTAFRIDPRTKNYQRTWKNSTFVGLAPVNNPAIVVAISFHNTAHDAGVIAAPVFRQVAMKSLSLLGVPQDVPLRQSTEEELRAPASPEAGDAEAEDEEVAEGKPATADEPLDVGNLAPDFRGKTMEDVIALARETKFNIEIAGSGIARSQKPRAGARLKPGERIRVVFAR
jgi:cell division protein FtsI (penicillin-binding protein 3)